MAILDISKTLMYQFWYDYIKPQNMEIEQNYAIRILMMIVKRIKPKEQRSM